MGTCLKFAAAALASLLISPLPTTASAERRVALIIGNDQYQSLPALKKAAADAQSYADVLQAKGFERVIVKTDLTRAQMVEAIAAFIDEIQPKDTAVFAYAGHGWSDSTVDYIVGTDAPHTGSQEFLKLISIPLKNGQDGIIDEMQRTGATLKVIIVDACRDNPFIAQPGKRGIGIERGLVRIDPPLGTFVVFSAGAGQTALDQLSNTDNDPNSVFTRVFVPLIRADLPLQDAMKTTREKVVALARTADQDQVPAYYDEVIGRACLSANCEQGSPSPKVLSEGPPVPQPTNDIDRAYQKALLANTISAYDDFIGQFPKTEEAKKALKFIEILSDEQSWGAATGSDSIDRYSLYLAQHPDGIHVDEAHFRIKKLVSDAVKERTPIENEVALVSKPLLPAPLPSDNKTLYHYVTGLNPNGFNWLALRVGPSFRSTWSETIKIPPQTLLTKRGEQGEWMNVVLPSGEAGWVRSRYVACCRKADTAPGTNEDARSWVTLTGRDAYGGDYSELKDAAQPVCEDKCRTDSQCKAFSFDRWNRICYLKSSIGLLRMDPRIVTEVLASEQLTDDSSPSIMIGRQNKAFPDSAYLQSRTDNYDKCNSVCLQDQDCSGFNYRQNDHLCS